MLKRKKIKPITLGDVTIIDDGKHVKSLDAKLAIPMDMAVEFMTQIAKLEGYQQDDAEKLAKQQVQ
ncbi:hypothetical protein MJL79_28535, partial [Salmonella enterica subsp. enterica serovar Montevideo]|nr:hypothetical protein [Salmonella enterica subsp. enterica serovar Montevideo]